MNTKDKYLVFLKGVLVDTPIAPQYSWYWTDLNKEASVYYGMADQWYRWRPPTNSVGKDNWFSVAASQVPEEDRLGLLLHGG